MPIYKGSRLSLRAGGRTGGSITGITRGPCGLRNSKNILFYFDYWLLDVCEEQKLGIYSAPICILFLSSASLSHNRRLFLKTNFSDEKRKFKEKFRHTMPLGWTMQQSYLSFKNVAKSAKASHEMSIRCLLFLKCLLSLKCLLCFLSHKIELD